MSVYFLLGMHISCTALIVTSADSFALMLYFCTTELTELNASVKESNKFHNYKTEKITHKASDVAEYIELFGSSARDRHARRI